MLVSDNDFLNWMNYPNFEIKRIRAATKNGGFFISSRIMNGTGSQRVILTCACRKCNSKFVYRSRQLNKREHTSKEFLNLLDKPLNFDIKFDIIYECVD